MGIFSETVKALEILQKVKIEVDKICFDKKEESPEETLSIFVSFHKEAKSRLYNRT